MCIAWRIVRRATLVVVETYDAAISRFGEHEHNDGVL